MKTSVFWIVVLAAILMAGCGQKESKPAQNAEEQPVAVDTAATKPEAAVAPVEDAKPAEAPAEEPAEEEIAPKKKGTLAKFFGLRWQGDAEAYLVGKIDNKYPVHMSLWWEVEGHEGYYDPETDSYKRTYMFGVRGAYYYDKTGSVKNYMTLQENNINKNHVVISEYNSKGKHTGTFDGRVKGDVYEGSFIRAKDGKRMPFKLTYVLDKNNGKFVKSTAY